MVRSPLGACLVTAAVAGLWSACTLDRKPQLSGARGTPWLSTGPVAGVGGAAGAGSGEAGTTSFTDPIVRKQANAFLAAPRVHGERFHYFDTGIKRLIIELELEDVAIFLVHL